MLLGGAQGRVVHVLGPLARRLEVERVDGDDRLVLHDARPVHGRELNVGQEPPGRFSHVRRPAALFVHDRRRLARLDEPPRCQSRYATARCPRKSPEDASRGPCSSHRAIGDLGGGNLSRFRPIFLTAIEGFPWAHRARFMDSGAPLGTRNDFQ